MRTNSITHAQTLYLGEFVLKAVSERMYSISCGSGLWCRPVSGSVRYVALICNIEGVWILLLVSLFGRWSPRRGRAGGAGFPITSTVYFLSSIFSPSVQPTEADGRHTISLSSSLLSGAHEGILGVCEWYHQENSPDLPYVKTDIESDKKVLGVEPESHVFPVSVLVYTTYSGSLSWSARIHKSVIRQPHANFQMSYSGTRLWSPTTAPWALTPVFCLISAGAIIGMV